MKLKEKKVFAVTLGCRLNQADTALIYSRLTNLGFEILKSCEQSSPDLIVINTCTVTANASSKSRRTARHFRNLFPDACIAVTGCDCNNSLENWKNQNIDILLLNSEKKLLADKVLLWFQNKNNNLHTLVNASTLSELSKNHLTFYENTIAKFPFRKRAFLKIQEGCNAFCSYCIVPYVRGPEKSRNPAEILDEAEALVNAGHREIIITGVNISSYECDSYDIISLIKKISQIPGDFRIRLSSMEPHVKNLELIELIRDNSKICRFMHIPLQSGSDCILKFMNRKYSVADFENFVLFARKQVDGIHIGTDIIVGFPGENHERFEESLAFLKKMKFANTHVFRFSPRKGTPAADFKNQIPHKLVKNRAEIIQNIANNAKSSFLNSQINSKFKLLVESLLPDNCAIGITDNYIKVKISNNITKPGEFIPGILKNDMILS